MFIAPLNSQVEQTQSNGVAGAGELQCLLSVGEHVHLPWKSSLRKSRDEAGKSFCAAASCLGFLVCQVCSGNLNCGTLLNEI